MTCVRVGDDPAKPPKTLTPSGGSDPGDREFGDPEASTPRNVKFGKYVGAGQDVFMTVKLRAVEAPCRRLTCDAKLLESQFLHDAAASVVTVEVPDADRLR